MNNIRTYRHAAVAAVLLLVAAALATTGCRNASCPPEVMKETGIFSVKGDDTLRYDRYYSPGCMQCADTLSASPVVMFAFGGGFKGGDRASGKYLEYFEFLAREGYNVVSVDYRTMLAKADTSALASPMDFVAVLQGAVDTAVADLYDATTYVLERQKNWNIDPKLVIISGSSAGAITVLQAEYYLCNSALLASRLPEGFRYAGVLSFAGAISSADSLHWDTLPCPIMLFHGDADRVVPFRSAYIPRLGGLWGSSAIADCLDAAETSYSFFTIVDAGHEIATLPMTRNLYDIAGFLSSQVLGARKLAVRTVESVPGAPHAEKDFTITDYLNSNR